MNLPSSFAQADLVDQDFTLPASQHAAAFLALKALWDEEMVSLPLSDDPMVLARALNALMRAHGWSCGLSLTGNLVGLYHDGVAHHPHNPSVEPVVVNVTGDAERVFTALAPFVEDGCSLSYQEASPSRRAWSVVFADKTWLVEQDEASSAVAEPQMARAHA